MRYLFILALFITACDPVKKVLRDPQKLDEVRQKLIETGMCVNDTVTVETFIQGEDSIVKVPCDDFDSTGKDSVRIYVKDSVLKYIKINKVITKIVRDTKLEDQLKAEIKKKDAEILKLKSKVVDLSGDVNKLNKKSFRLGIILSCVVLLSGLIIFRKPIAKAVIRI